MSTATLPRCVSANTDIPHYFFRTAAEDLTFLRFSPFLPDVPGMRWADDGEITEPHIVFTQTIAAELLALAPDVPPGMTDDEAIAAIDKVLAAHRCNLKACVEELAQEYGEHPDVMAARMSRCVALAARLLEVEA